MQNNTKTTLGQQLIELIPGTTLAQYTLLHTLRYDQNIPLETIQDILKDTNINLTLLTELNKNNPPYTVLKKRDLTSNVSKYNKILNTLGQKYGIPPTIEIMEELGNKGYIIYTHENLIYTAKREKKQDTTIIVPKDELIRARPIKIEKYQENIVNKNITIYHTTWINHLSHKFTLKGTLAEIARTFNEDYTETIGRPDVIKLAIKQLINYYEEQNQITIHHTPSQNGFYYDKEHDKIITVGYTPIQPTIKQLRTSLTLLEEYSQYFDKDKLATMIRWGLIAPFQYIIKQQHGTIKHIYLFGQAKCGKTIGYGYLPYYIYGLNHNQHMESGGGSNSKAQIADTFKKSTFPEIIDDSENIFANNATKNMIKTSTNMIYCRKVTRNEKMTIDPALAGIIFTSNHDITNTDNGALIRRIIKIEFTLNDTKTQQEVDTFNKHFHITNDKKNKLKQLKYIGQAFLQEVLKNPQLLQEDTTEQVNKFFENICQQTQYTKPLKWIYNKLTTTQQEEEKDITNRRENIADIIQQIINKQIHKIQVTDETGEYNLGNLKDPKYTWEERITHIANQGAISWFTLGGKSKDDIIIKLQITKELQKYGEDITGASLAQLFGWDYKTVKKNGKIFKAIKMNLKDFIEDIYGLVEYID